MLKIKQFSEVDHSNSMYNKWTKILFYELCLINFLFFLKRCTIYQILRKMQKIYCYTKS